MSLTAPVRLRVLPKLIPLDGKSVEMQATDTALQWRLVGSDTWADVVPLSDITGPQGPKGDTGQDGTMASVVAGLNVSIDSTDPANPIISAAGDVSSTATDASSFGFVVDEDDMASDSATKVPTQQSVKAFASNSNNVLFTPSETGGVARSVFNILKQRIRAYSFGCDADNTAAANRAAINNAVNAAGSNGAVVELPAGTIQVDGTVIPLASNVTFAGQGEATNLQTTSATANVLDVSAADVEVRDLKFTSSVARTAGRYVNLQGTAKRFKLRNFRMNAPFEGIALADGLTSVRIDNGQIYDTVAATGVCIRVEGGLDIKLTGIITSAVSGSNPFAGIHVTNVGDLTINDCQILQSGIGINLQPASGDSITSVWSNNTFYDNCGNMGLQGFANGGAIARCIFDECWFSSSGTYGIRLRTALSGMIDGIDFVNPHIFLNGSGGASIDDSGVINVSFINPAVEQNTGAGLNFASGVNKFRVDGGKIGSGYGLTGNTTYGIVLGGSNDNFSIYDASIVGNTTGAINLNSQTLSTTKRIDDCIGFLTKNRITIAGTTDASGNLTASHGLGLTPTRAIATAFGGTFQHAQITSFTSTDVTIKVFDAAGAAIASTAIVGIYVDLAA